MFKTNKLHIAICSATAVLSGTAHGQHELEEEVVVTATRRETTLQEVPYSISAYSGEDLAEAGITDFSTLSRFIPGLTMSDVGRGKNGISTGIVMRGLNLTGSAQEDFGLVTDPVVSVYLGETPLFANLELRDIERVEVLKGPQSTLYGSGSLGGTMRYIPVKPDFDKVSGYIKTKLSITDEADDLNHDLELAVNLPVSDTFAVRAVAAGLKYAGYIDSDFIAGLDANNQPTGVYSSAEDINEEQVSMARISARWMPTQNTDIVFSYTHQEDDVEGSAATSEGLEGYQTAAKIIEQFEREIDLASLVIDHDFADMTLTSATSMTSNEAENLYDQSYNYGYSWWWGSYYTDYYGYTGGVAPAAEVITGEKKYSTDTFTQEFRLTGGTDALDWLAGVFYNSVEYEAEAYDKVLGLDAAFNITNPFSRDLGYANLQETDFTDRAIFGELTFHITEALDVTVGARYFEQTFYAKQEVLLPACEEFWNTTLGFFACGDTTETDPERIAVGYAGNADEKDFDDILYRFNASYNFAEENKVYFNISQGFRHGGANGVPTTGIFGESEEYLFFESDKTTNYELGIKGSLPDSGLRYTVAAYYIDWEDPILLIQSPAGGFPIMVNGQEASSMGFEAEISARLMNNLLVSAGYSYTKAELTEDFFLPDGTLVGLEGQSLPGIPESTFVSSIEYFTDIGSAELRANLGISYKDGFATYLDYPQGLDDPSSDSPYENGYDEIDSSVLLNASVYVDIDQWSIGFFVDNLANSDDITASDGDAKYITDTAAGERKGGEQYSISSLGDQAYRLRPRTIGLSVRYEF